MPVTETEVWQGVAPKVPLVVPDTVAVTLSREARKRLVVKLSYRQPGARRRSRPASASGRPRSPPPDCRRSPLPLVAAGDVARAGLLARATGSLSYLIWGEPAG